ncbi:4-(cytidine 5'-diphospho)-2-C-methyl-D-erythritol kinase [Pseudoroseicyclus aestuarii]|uniref:4-diphosphocytidyl-2-C-methyl-D-erythritol kinase n=1 Tax=Pseudoroseicyclus aestuarii TaxID=1795041 RepID=A0A318SRT4_9RHOB|nr:4-(cytidine 5'-diphospho)-2-C-methyl-D-erythritol kinase [Pseudoroseicyclus aestuarii]PYE84651.1 4-diphosphocytidyl-2-C-methyl-D-erythritol kinase [Pseudoroseicyclus aestuarii]
MTKDTGAAPAKVNFTLHVTGRRAGGYHTLDSLVGFAGFGDHVSAVAATEVTLEIGGPFAAGLPTDSGNIVVKAAQMLREARGVTLGARIKLTKALPHAAGLGSGSADAAAVLRVLAKLWGVAPFAPGDPEVAELGADVPVCLQAPHAARMSGIGEVLSPVPRLPQMGLILVNPKIEVPTAKVFAALESHANPAMDEMPEGLDLDGFCAWLAAQRNDLQPAAEAIEPEIARVLQRLRRIPQVKTAFMSGSGATCVGITRDVAQARVAARGLQIAEMGWWVAPAPLLTGTALA